MPKGLLQRNGRFDNTQDFTEKYQKSFKNTLTLLEGQLTLKWVNTVNTWRRATFYESSQSSTNLESECDFSQRGHKYKMLMPLTVAMTYYWCKEFSPEWFPVLLHDFPPRAYAAVHRREKEKARMLLSWKLFLKKAPKYIDLKKYYRAVFVRLPHDTLHVHLDF